MAATMKDIANRTGLGLATISKYLNGGNVREKNRIAIEAAIRELDFTVNEVARGLKTRHTRTIGIVIPELSNVFITSVISAMEDILRQRGYGVLVCDSRTDPVLEQQAVQFLLNKRVDGIVVMPVSGDGASILPAIQMEIPVVLIDRLVEALDGQVDSVSVDNFRASYDSIDYLIQQGHQRIGIIAGPKGIYTSRQRLAGYRAAMERHHLPVSESMIHFSDYTLQGGYYAAEEFLACAPEATALFVTNYEMTLGTMLLFNEMGIKIPDQVSVIGFDNLELARIVNPKLTIVEQPIRELGIRTAEILLERFAKPEEAEKRSKVVLSTSLQLGNSVKKIVSSNGDRGKEI
jgi:LacI family transcriptional regulator